MSAYGIVKQSLLPVLIVIALMTPMSRAVGSEEAPLPGSSELVPCPPIPSSKRLAARRLEGHTAPCSDLAFSPDGTALTGACGDGSLVLWDLFETVDEPIRLGPVDGAPLFAVTYISDGSRLVAASTSGTITFWDTETLDLIQMLSAPGSSATSFAIHPDGRQLAVGTHAGYVYCWNLLEGVAVASAPDVALSTHRTVTALAYSSDPAPALWIGFSQGELQLWNPQSGRVLSSQGGSDSAVSALACPSSGGRILLSGNAGGDVTRWDMRAGDDMKCQWMFGTGIENLALSPRSDFVLVGTEDGLINAIRVEPCEFLGGVIGFMNGAVSSIAFHPCGEALACSGTGGDVALVDFEEPDGQ